MFSLRMLQLVVILSSNVLIIFQKVRIQRDGSSIHPEGCSKVPKPSEGKEGAFENDENSSQGKKAIETNGNDENLRTRKAFGMKLEKRRKSLMKKFCPTRRILWPSWD